MKKYNQLTLFAVDSLAKTSQQPAKAEALSMVTGLVFGGQCTDLLITYSQELQCWKTCKPCCGKTEACTLSCKTWPQSGMMQNGALYQQDNLVHPTCEKESLLLPTPTTSEHKYRLKGNSQASKCLEALARTGQLSGQKGRLNPEFVTWLMGFPEGWTK